MNCTDPAVKVVEQAETLIRSLKGVQDARVHADADGRIARIVVSCPGVDDRTATRNVQSALFAVLGVALAPGVLQISAYATPSESAKVLQKERGDAEAQSSRQLVTQKVVAMMQQSVTDASRDAVADMQVVDFGNASKRADLNVAARVAFDTLRAAQSSFHGFLFDGAELVKISGSQYVVVAVRRSTTEARYCGAAPVIDSVSTASARALMNAVGLAAMGSPAVEFAAGHTMESLEA